ncbi:MAG: endonuclease/exonuclease/phosphatase family protein [Bdellovibrionota bacterium]
MSAKYLRILSYNIHKGFTVRNRAYVLSEIREAIRTVSPDVVFLQEVMGEKQGEMEPQFEFMADSIWPHFAYGKNAVYQGGHHGNAILSKYPILHWENQDVSTSSLERRGLLHAVIKPFESRPEMHLLCVHFGLFERDRQLQAALLCERIKQKVAFGHGLVVAGDFNDWALRLSKFFKKELGLEEAYHRRHKRHARTFPARMPILRLDRIYYHGFEIRAARCLHSDIWANLSDHAALLAELEWP